MGPSRPVVRYSFSTIAIVAFWLGRGGVKAQYTDGGDVSMDCEVCSCGGTSDVGSIEVFYNPSSGDRIASVNGGYTEVLETTCGASVIEVDGTLFELSGLDLTERHLEVVDLSASDCTTEDTPASADCYNGTTEGDLPGGIQVNFAFCRCDFFEDGSNKFKALAQTSFKGSEDVSMIDDSVEVCLQEGAVIQLVTVLAEDILYYYTFDLAVSGEPSSEDLDVSSAPPSPSVEAELCGDREENETEPTPSPEKPSPSPVKPSPSPVKPSPSPVKPSPSPTAPPVPEPTPSPSPSPPPLLADVETEPPSSALAPTTPSVPSPPPQTDREETVTGAPEAAPPTIAPESAPPTIAPETSAPTAAPEVVPPTAAPPVAEGVAVGNPTEPPMQIIGDDDTLSGAVDTPTPVPTAIPASALVNVDPTLAPESAGRTASPAPSSSPPFLTEAGGVDVLGFQEQQASGGGGEGIALAALVLLALLTFSPLCAK